MTVDEPTVKTAPPSVVSTQLQERLSEQQRAATKLKRIRLAIGGGVAALVIGLAYLFLFSPVFALSADEVEIVGTSDPQALSAIAAQVQEVEGTPLLRLDIDGFIDDLTQIPQVRDASVNRSWPNGLLIHVEPREVAVGIATDEGFALLDREAVQIGVVAEVPEGVPTIQARLESIDQRTLEAVLSVIDSMQPELASDVASIQVENQDNIQLTLTDGVKVEWGSGEENALKAEVLMLLRASEEASAGVTVFDVSSPTMPVTH